MKSLIICALCIVATQSLVAFQFDNQCETVWPVWNSVQIGNARHIYDLPARKSLCTVEFEGHRRFTFGKNGKTMAEFQINLLRTIYNLNVVSGFDVAMRIVPVFEGQVNGTIIECLTADCANAVHTMDEYYIKQKKSFADTMHIILCPGRSKIDMDPNCITHP